MLYNVGSAEPHSTVFGKMIKALIAFAATDENGNFKVKMDKQKMHAVIFVSAADSAKNESEIVQIHIKGARSF